MPGVFLNLSFTTSPVTSATYSEQGVTVPADRVCEKRHSCSRHILYLPIPQNENEDAICLLYTSDAADDRYVV